jgi:hypothetical protein
MVARAIASYMISLHSESRIAVQRYTVLGLTADHIDSVPSLKTIPYPLKRVKYDFRTAPTLYSKAGVVFIGFQPVMGEKPGMFQNNLSSAPIQSLRALWDLMEQRKVYFVELTIGDY